MNDRLRRCGPYNPHNGQRAMILDPITRPDYASSLPNTKSRAYDHVAYSFRFQDSLQIQITLGGVLGMPIIRVPPCMRQPG